MKLNFEKTITDVPFFKACGISAGIKKSGKKDLCIIYSERKAVSAAALTTNKVKAAPVLLNMEYIKNSNTQAIVVNSGYANACTGGEGIYNAKMMSKITADCLGLKKEEVLVASTGVIGVQLPMEIITSGIKNACSKISVDGGIDAALAIMTTDTFPKRAAVETVVGGKNIILSGMAKGSGMIHPNMGTMLSFIVTDVNISKELLQKALKDSIEDSYNMVSVDGDTSTNDMVIVLANGAAGNDAITSAGKDYDNFKAALDLLNKELAKKIAKDGEGSTKLIEVELYNARTLQDAKICAKSIITSSLVKSAFFGNDANWGRILCAIGYSGADFNLDKINISFKSNAGAIKIVKDGIGLNFDEDTAKKILDKDYVNVTVDLNDGIYNATAWGCDLTYDYVKINGSYRS
jgi:glutamate N-acetyltransferase/amino-acid N-acetyltransferase